MAELFKLGDDEGSVHKVRAFVILMLAVVTVSWFAINVPDFFEKSRVFWLLGITGLILVTTSFVITGKFGLNFNVPLAETPLLNIDKKWIIAAALIAFPVTFFFISATSYTVLSPSFQIIEIGLGEEALLVAAAAVTEDIFFFVFLPGFAFSILFFMFSKVVGNKKSMTAVIVTIALTIIIVPSVFTLYHTLVYGFVDVVRSTVAFIFGVEMTVWMIVFRDVIYPHMRHTGNNLGLLVFSQTNTTQFFINLFSNPLTYVVIVAIAAGSFLYIRNRKRR